MKQISIDNQYLQSFVQNNVTREQTAEMFTQPLNKALFIYLQRN